MATRTPSERSGTTSIPLMVKLLGAGLCATPGDGIEIAKGAYFKRAELGALQFYCDKCYVFNPMDIGVVLGGTVVRIDGKSHVVKSFDHGKYKLEGRESTLTPWELLRDRCDGGVTLDAYLRRFIINLVQKQTVMMSSVVPHTSGTSGNVLTGIAKAHVDKIDTESKTITIDELMEIKEKVESLRDLSLRIFTKVQLNNTLPANFWGDERDEALYEFAEQPGSLSQINCLGGLGLVTYIDQVKGCLFSGDLVRGWHTLAPPTKRTRGSWEATLRSVSKLLTCAYRMGRAGNLLDAYHPLTLHEAKILQDHHRHWSAILAHSLRNLNVRETRSTNTIDSELGGEKSFPLCFALERGKTFVHVLPPVVVVGCGIRDADKYGRLAWTRWTRRTLSRQGLAQRFSSSCWVPAAAPVRCKGSSVRSTYSSRMQGISESKPRP
ncbi:unnamed protein product [Hapterophycus canaliculatus]